MALADRVPANIAAARLASSCRTPIALNTTQWNAQPGYCSANRRTVPPQPISISSECAPKHKICSGSVEPLLKLSWIMREPISPLIRPKPGQDVLCQTFHGAELWFSSSRRCLSLKVSMHCQKPVYLYANKACFSISR